MSQIELHVSTGGQKGTVIPLPPGKFLIGREEDCQLRPNSDLISRHHCVFNVDEFGVRLRDLGSTNGTLVNGERVRAVHVLKHGDLVAVGRLEFRVVLDGAPVTETTPDDTVASADDLDTMMEGLEVTSAADRPTPTPASFDTGETHTEMPLISDETRIASQGTPVAETGFYYPSTPQMPMPGMPYGQVPYGYPGYPMQPMGGFYPGMGYPQQMYPQYPQQPYPGQPMPQQQQPQPEPVTTAPGNDKTQEVRLPDPSDTGAKPPEPKPEAVKDAKGEIKKNVPDMAAGIIKQYLQRRPT